MDPTGHALLVQRTNHDQHLPQRARGCRRAGAAPGDLGGDDVTSILAGALGPLRDNGGTTQTHVLLDGSPAIDGGLNANCSSAPKDQRCKPRPLEGDGVGEAVCDSGAYEYPGIFWSTVCLIGVTDSDSRFFP